MNWFQRHLNWTWAISMAVQFTTIGFDSPAPYIILHILFWIATIWVLHRKSRSIAWILIPISVLFLDNRRVDREIEL